MHLAAGLAEISGGTLKFAVGVFPEARPLFRDPVQNALPHARGFSTDGSI